MLQKMMPHDRPVSRTFFQRTAPEVASGLIGVTLLVGGVGGIIVETEAYDRDDPASHSFRGRGVRNASMFEPPGCAYVYRSYGIHWCLNAVCGGESAGSAVLIRALEPVAGIDVMCERRKTSDLRQLCRGPGRLCQALGITGVLDGAALDKPPFLLLDRSGPASVSIGPRIGITKGVATPWRFGLSGSLFLSRPIAPRNATPPIDIA